MKYLRRISDNQVTSLLKTFGGILIEGPKWCGKTSTGTEHAASVFEVADPTDNFSNRELARINPTDVLSGNFPRLIDEWQEVPQLWDAVRFAIDKQSLRGAYILTGSSTPNDRLIIHSGAGRIVRLRMSTMSLSELGVSKRKISLGEILTDDDITPEPSKSTLRLDKLIELVIRGGWPSMINDDIESVTQLANSYLDSISSVDISKVDSVKRDPNRVMALLRSLSRNVATLVTNDTLIRDISSIGSTNISANAITDYLNVLKRIFILEEIPAWDPALKSPVRLRRSPKRFLFDSSLSVAGLGASIDSLKHDLKLFGNLFESFVIHDLLVYAQANDAKVFHYNDNTGLEIDSIIERRNGDWTAIEIKLSNYYEDDAASNLLRLKQKMLDGGQKPPTNLVIITGIGGIMQRREDGVLVVPADYLFE
jgi:predicted AAA+ superfamily ATPase